MIWQGIIQKSNSEVLQTSVVSRQLVHNVLVRKSVLNYCPQKHFTKVSDDSVEECKLPARIIHKNNSQGLKEPRFLAKMFQASFCKTSFCFRTFLHTDSVFQRSHSCIPCKPKNTRWHPWAMHWHQEYGTKPTEVVGSQNCAGTVHPSSAKPTFEITAGSKIVTLLGS